ncbi:MAG: hypothetical protein MJ003_02320 [Paludibacteraceae bacterium]|nr:hypothetical protein [Paludibacteraceae bacterium]
MISSQNKILLDFYASKATVISMAQLRMMYPDLTSSVIALRMNHYVKSGRLLNPRKGFYAKPAYNPLELACMLYTPTYISLDYVLRKAGVIFQYGEEITMISYLNREIDVDGNIITYNRIKGEIMADTRGIIQDGNVNTASPERAFLDTLYLNANYYFDNISILNKETIEELLPIYQCKRLTERVNKILKQ